MIVANWLSGTILLLVIFPVVFDLAILITAALKLRRVSPPRPLRYGIGVAALSLAAFAVSNAIRVPPVNEIEVAIRNLPREFEGYRMIQLTDLHISRLFQAPWVEELVARTNAQNADLIVISGDLIDGDLTARRADVEPLSGLRARDGIFTIPGNHEYYFGHDDWMRRYQELGMTTISNGHVVVARGDARLVVAGVNDLAATRHQLVEPPM